MSVGRMKIAVKGGIGDFLQCLPFMMTHPEHRYLVASHHDRVSEFFGSLGLEVEEVSLGRLGGAYNCPRRVFFDGGVSPFARRSRIFSDHRLVVGVHLGGSDYSISVERRFGFPTKNLPPVVLDGLVRAGTRYNFLLFGSPSEINILSPTWRDLNMGLVVEEDVTASLSHVVECDALVGSDSAFKTMSAMMRIPTVTWVGDYRDDFRDEKFIDPYVKAGAMSVFKYKDLGSLAEVEAGVSFSLDQIKKTNEAHPELGIKLGLVRAS